MSGALTARLSCGTRKPDRQIASQLNLYGSAVNVRFQNPATPQPLRPLRFQKRTFTARFIIRFDTFNRMEFLAAFWNGKAVNFVRHHPLSSSVGKMWPEVARQNVTNSSNEFAALCCIRYRNFAAICRNTRRDFISI
jgi:hypothetical protein